MKLSHVIVAVVFFVLGALGAYCYLLSGAKVAVSASNVAVTAGDTSVKVETTTPSVEAPAPAAVTFKIEMNVNRQAGDYRDYEMAAGADYKLCEKACEGETQCKAYTFVKAGPRGAVPHCWLKKSVPMAYSDDQCITGVKQ